jgi:hypothetical protein
VRVRDACAKSSTVLVGGQVNVNWS